MPQLDKQKKKRLFRRLLWMFCLAFLLSNGPGLYLVNYPLLIGGIPILYLWGLFGAIVQIWIITYAYLKLWRDETEVDITPLQDELASGKGAGR